jgi:hypothetical protein
MFYRSCSLEWYTSTHTNHVLVAIDQFASKEGLPAGADPIVNNLVNDEINKF